MMQGRSTDLASGSELWQMSPVLSLPGDRCPAETQSDYVGLCLMSSFRLWLPDLWRSTLVTRPRLLCNWP